MASERTLINPPTYLARLTGVHALSIGVRSVIVQGDVTTYRFARKHLPRVLPAEFAALAAMAWIAGREHGVECDPIFRAPREPVGPRGWDKIEGDAP